MSGGFSQNDRPFLCDDAAAPVVQVKRTPDGRFAPTMRRQAGWLAYGYPNALFRLFYGYDQNLLLGLKT